MEPMFPVRCANTSGLFSKSNTAVKHQVDLTFSLILNRWHCSKSRAHSSSPQLPCNNRLSTVLDTSSTPLFVSVTVCALYATNTLLHFILNKSSFQLHLRISRSLRTCPCFEPTSTIESHLIKTWPAQHQDHRGNICFEGLSFLWGINFHSCSCLFLAVIFCKILCFLTHAVSHSVTSTYEHAPTPYLFICDICLN